MKFSKKRISDLLESSKMAISVAMNDEEIKNALRACLVFGDCPLFL